MKQLLEGKLKLLWQIVKKQHNTKQTDKNKKLQKEEKNLGCEMWGLDGEGLGC